jgi:putative MATE family efflux protein
MVETTGSIGKRGAVGRDWTEGSIIQNLWLLSWPVIVLMALYSVNLILELIWVGKLGPASIAGVGVGGFVVLLVLSVKSGLGAGERAMVARFIGAGEAAAANHIAGQCFLISAAYGALITLIGALFTGPIIGLFGLEAETAAEGILYLRIVLIGWITEAFWMTSFSVMQASGDSLTPMKIAIIIRVVNAAVCPFLVLGGWIIPRMGVSGAAITYIVATGLGMAICLWALFTGQTRLRLTLKDFYPDPQAMWRILKVGLPVSLMGLGKAFGDLILTWLLIPFGTTALAAHNIISRIESFINTPSTGLGTGAGVLVGQNLGARQAKRASRSGWLAMGLVAGFMICCSVALLLLSETIIRFFTADPDLVKLGALFLRIATAGYLGLCIVLTMQYCIPGSGDTLAPMFITIGALWVVLLPLAYLLSRFTGLGVYGVRWAIVVGFTVGAIAYITYFWKGRWKRKKV